MTRPLDILQKYWNYTRFRPLQEDIIQSVLEQKDTLALLPTGGGKSVCFQVPAMILEGVCLVISPLIALMKDQTFQLNKRGIPAKAIFSGMSKREIDRTLEDCVKGKYKFLYISPERLKTDILQERVKRMTVGLLAVDESHCISQWGYDFRPAYLEILEFKKQFLPQNISTIALTATATEPVKKDIQEKLGFGESARVFQKSFARANLSYSCFLEEDKEKRLLKILNNVKGTSVVYVRNRRRTKSVAQYLRQNKIRADFYHAGLSPNERSHKQDAWISNKIRVIVSTNAFGMGIDKADVRSVVHLDLPDTLEAYYQEAGRAGRDEKKAYAVALYNQNDIADLERKVESTYPSIKYIKTVYQALGNYYNLATNAGGMQSFDFQLADFQGRFETLKGLKTYYALKILESEGFLQFNESFYNPSSLQFLLSYKDLYEYQMRNPKLENIIKVVLRLYEGSLNNFVSIRENNIAKLLNMNTSIVEKQLQYLHDNKILIYEKAREKPQILFLKPRQQAEHLQLDKKKIESRKKRDMEKVKAVTSYVQHQNRCRTQLLLEYFGEVSYEPCGVCDICLSKKKKDKLQNLEKDYKEKILYILQKESYTVKELVRRVEPQRETDLIALLRQMVDFGTLKYEKNGTLSLG